MVYKVASLYEVVDTARPLARPWLNPRPPEEWLARRCKRCSRDANPDGERSRSGGVLSFADDTDEADALTDDGRERVRSDFERVAGALPPDGELRVDDDGWVWLRHAPEAHLRVMDWLRARLCPHGQGR